MITLNCCFSLWIKFATTFFAWSVTYAVEYTCICPSEFKSGSGCFSLGETSIYREFTCTCMSLYMSVIQHRHDTNVGCALCRLLYITGGFSVQKITLHLKKQPCAFCRCSVTSDGLSCIAFWRRVLTGSFVSLLFCFVPAELKADVWRAKTKSSQISLCVTLAHLLPQTHWDTQRDTDSGTDLD